MDQSFPVQDGLVIANYGRTLLVEASDGECRPCAARKTALKAVSGDVVQWQAQADGSGIVLGVKPRKAVLARPDQRGISRPVCANIDQIAVVGAIQASHEGSFRLAGIDSYLAAAELLGIEAVVLVTKIDLLPGDDRASLDATMAPYRAAGYPVIYASTHTQEGISALRERLCGRRSVFVGESGVGKSSLTQILLPDRDIRIGELSASSGLGRHTTTVTVLFHIPGGNGDIIDSPGVREFRLGQVAAPDLAGAFREFRDHTGACRYRNCRHLGEPACAVEAAVAEGRISRERLESYRGILLAMEDEPGGGPRRVTR